MKSQRYKDGYTMEEMINRIVYWFFRYKGTRTEDGKEILNLEMDILIERLQKLKKFPDEFKFANPDMGVTF